MRAREPLRTIVYPDSARPGVPFVAAFIWSLILYLIPLLLAVHYVLHPSLSPKEWFGTLSALTTPGWRLALGGLALFGLCLLAGRLLQAYVWVRGGVESETREVLIGMTDTTSLGAWDRALRFVPLAGAIALAASRFGGLLELLLGLVLYKIGRAHV